MFRDATNGDRDDVESLVRVAGGCPDLSRGLCERIVAQAVPARAAVVRRRRAFAAVAAAVSLVLASYFGRWPSLPSVRLEALLASRSITGSSAVPGRDAMTVARDPASEARDADWIEVESLTAVRRRQGDLLRSALRA